MIRWCGAEKPCLPVQCRRRVEPHAQIPRYVDGIGDETVKLDRREQELSSLSSTSLSWTRSYHRIPSSCLRHFWWKASRVLTSVDSKVQVSAAYSNTNETGVWYIWNLVSNVSRLSLHIRFRDVMTAQARPMRRVRVRTTLTI